MTVQFRRFTSSHPTRSARKQPFALPCRLGRWRLHSVIGRGSLSRVYRASAWHCWPPQPNCPPKVVAIKVLRESWEDRPRAVGQFACEAAVIGQVKHPHLIHLVDSDLNNPPFFLVLPWVSGTCLSTWRGASRRPALADILRWMRQIASALVALDESGWMHGDVKPSNMLVNQQGDAVLIDLGFARRTKDDEDAARPLVGTLNYMAPEMIYAPELADIRSDLYSFGVSLFELLTGRLPFPGPTAADVIKQHRKTPPQPLKELAPDTPPRLQDLVALLMEKKPTHRPKHPSVVYEELQAIEQTAPAVAETIPSPHFMKKPVSGGLPPGHTPDPKK